MKKTVWDLELPSFELEVGDEVFDIFIAKTEEARRKGLSDLDELDADTGMLFIFNTPGAHQMWMKNTTFALDIVFVDTDNKIVEIVDAIPEDTGLVGKHDNVKFVLELPSGTVNRLGIETNDDLDLDDVDDLESTEEPSSEKSIKILDQDGKTQMEIQGGERIFSRKSTKIIVEKSQQAESDQDLIELGRYVAQEITRQNARDPQYSSSSTTEYDSDINNK